MFLVLFILLTLVTFQGNSVAQFTILHNFTGAGNDGSRQAGSLLNVDGALYGMTQYGGAPGSGLIFSINADGSVYTKLHEFAGPPDDGGFPLGGLIMQDHTI